MKRGSKCHVIYVDFLSVVKIVRVNIGKIIPRLCPWYTTIAKKNNRLFQVIFASALPEVYDYVTTGGKYSGKYRCEKGKK